MRRRKLQKKCNSENATLEVASFRILRCICFGAVAFLFAFFSFFFRKKNTKVDQSCKKKCNGENATSQVAKKMQRRKCNVGSCIFFAFSVPDELFMYRIFVSLHPFAFHYTPPPNPSSRPCPSPQLHLTLSAFHACSLLFTPLSPSTLSSEQEWRCWVEAEMNM